MENRMAIQVLPQGNNEIIWLLYNHIIIIKLLFLYHYLNLIFLKLLIIFLVQITYRWTFDVVLFFFEFEKNSKIIWWEQKETNL
jgi:hypothetical protein